MIPGRRSSWSGRPSLQSAFGSPHSAFVRYWPIMDQERLERLARRLEAAVKKDAERIRREREIVARRGAAAFELYVICSNLVRNLNALCKDARLELAPPEFSPDSFREAGPNLFQISVSGRILQIAFEATEPVIATENCPIPYTLEGAVRWFDQQSLETLGIQEHSLFCCLEGDALVWRWFDPQTHRNGLVDEDYLAARLEELLD